MKQFVSFFQAFAFHKEQSSQSRRSLICSGLAFDMMNHKFLRFLFLSLSLTHFARPDRPVDDLNLLA